MNEKYPRWVNPPRIRKSDLVFLVLLIVAVYFVNCGG